jgi:hypothetical protein
MIINMSDKENKIEKWLLPLLAIAITISWIIEGRSRHFGPSSASLFVWGVYSSGEIFSTGLLILGILNIMLFICIIIRILTLINPQKKYISFIRENPGNFYVIATIFSLIFTIYSTFELMDLKYLDLGEPGIGIVALYLEFVLLAILTIIMKQKRKYNIAIFLMLIILLPIGVYYSYEPQLEKGLLISHDLFTEREDGYHTYRIPALISMPNNTIIAFCEGRKDSPSDFGNIDMVMKRSTDGGQTWSQMKVIWDADELAVQNACPVYDNVTETLFLLVILDRKDTYILNSTDFGITGTLMVLVRGTAYSCKMEDYWFRASI